MPVTRQALFISHGGGPMPLLGEPGHQQLVDTLKQLALTLPKPRAILLISAHWEEEIATVTSAAAPGLFYDYSGFPATAYQIQYPAVGEPALAAQVVQSLQQAGLAARADTKRNFDHGMFVPLKIMYPQADIPCVQLSLLHSLDASAHLALGKALRSVQYPGLLVLGSGFSFHNMREFFATPTPEATAKNQAFEHWLLDTCSNTLLTEAEREQRLQHWAQAPAARFCHPREEHLLPLHVCAAYAGNASKTHYATTVLGKMSGMFYWVTNAEVANT